MTRAGRALCVPFVLSFGALEISGESGTPINLEEGARHLSEIRGQDLPSSPYQLKLNHPFDPYGFGSYHDEETSLAGQLTVSGGVRYDSFGSFDELVEKHAGLSYWLDQSALRAQYSEAYIGSDIAALRYSAYTTDLNATVEPGKLRSYTVGVEQKFGSILRGSISGFYLEQASLENEEASPVRDMINYSISEHGGYYGAEAELEAKWAGGISSRLSYAYALPDDNGNPASSNSPKHFGRLNFFLPVVHEILFAGLELQTSSSRVMLAGNDAKEYAVMNTILFAHSLAKGLDVTAIIYNLFDSRTSYVGAGSHWQDLVYQDARTFKLKLTYRF